MSEPQPILRVEGLSTAFPGPDGPIRVVDDVSFEVDRGEVLALVGESGCGKSITAFSLLRLVPRPGRVVAGRILLEGRNLLDLPVPEMRSVRGRQAAMIFQEPMTSLNPVQTVGTQVVEAIQLHERVDADAARRRTTELFDRVGIPDPGARFDAYPHQLSGGMKQRVMIAMALSSQPKLLIADEPTTALDVTIQAQIIDLLRELQRDSGLSILLITHDLGIVNELADRVAVMYAARLVEEGSRETILGAAEHPYTQGLLRSMPALARRGEPLAEIAGTVPPPDEWPPGCRFAGRCDRVLDFCASELPGETVRGPEHVVRCHAVARGTPAVERGT
ncbi:MAG: ABC transporter ATP-binding protein [Myxococcales bacterium]|nr:ABC transporter ATP-binding protein [Myxococcales bacterium]